MKHYFTLGIFVLFMGATVVWAQQTKIDNWLDSLDNYGISTEKRLNLLSKLGFEYRNIDPAKAEEYGEKALQLALKLEDSVSIARSHQIIGISYAVRGNYQKALGKYLDGLRIQEARGDKDGMATNLSNIGGIYYYENEWDLALKYVTQGLRLKEELEEVNGIADGHFSLGLIYQQKENDSLAIAHFEQALTVYRELGSRQREAGIYHSLATIYKKRKNLHQALEYFQHALAIKEEIGDKKGVTHASNSLGQLYAELREFSEAEKYLNQAYALASELGFKNEIMLNYLYVSRMDSIRGDYQNAYSHYRKYASIKSDLHNQDRSRQIAEMETRYRVEKQQIQLEAKDATIEKQRLAVLTIFIGLLSALVVAFVFYRLNRQKQLTNEVLANQKRKIQLQKSELEELNRVKDKWFSIISHDFRGPLTFLQSAMEMLNEGNLGEQDKQILTQEINDRVNRTSNLLDNLLYWAQSQVDGLEFKEEEVAVEKVIAEVIASFTNDADEKGVKLQQLVFGFPPILADKSVLILILQNLITYSLYKSKEGDEISVRAKQVDNQIQIEVLADGLDMEEVERRQFFHMDSDLIINGTAEERNTGLQMVLARDFLEKLGGKLSVESANTFKLSFPNRMIYA